MLDLHVESTMSHYAMLLLASVPVMLFCLFRQYGITVVLGVGTIFMGTVSEMGVEERTFHGLEA